MPLAPATPVFAIPDVLSMLGTMRNGSVQAIDAQQVSATVVLSGSTTAVASVNTADYDFKAGVAYLACVANIRNAGGVSNPTITGVGMSWSGTGQGSADLKQTIYGAHGANAAATSGHLTLDFSGVVQDNIAWMVLELTGADASAAGVNIVVQASSARGTSTTPSVTLGAFAKTGNATIGVVWENNGGFSAGGGYTGMGHAVSGANNELAVQFRNDSDTSVDCAITSSDWLMLAFEIKSTSFEGAMGAGPLIYRDVTLTGNATMTGLLVCRSLNLNGFRLGADGLGSPPGYNGAGGGGGAFTLGNATSSAGVTCTAAIVPASGVPYDPLEALFAIGGTGGNGGAANNGTGGGAFNVSPATSTLLLINMLLYSIFFLGARGGGGGGCGGGGSVGGATTGGTGGRRGLQGGAGSGVNECAGGGGSGFGAGGGGGGENGAGFGASPLGYGGGVIVVICDAVIGSVGTISANGADGGNNSGGGTGGNGGGGGGAAICFARTVAAAPTMQANAGAGGIGSGGTQGNGGNGGAGVAMLVRG